MHFYGYVRHTTISLNAYYCVLFSSRFRFELESVSGWLVVMHTFILWLYYFSLSWSLSRSLEAAVVCRRTRSGWIQVERLKRLSSLHLCDLLPVYGLTFDACQFARTVLGARQLTAVAFNDYQDSALCITCINGAKLIRDF